MNSVGIDVSKGKSMIAVMRPFGEVAVSPFEVRHTDSELCELAKLLRSLPGETRVVMEATGNCGEPRPTRRMPSSWQTTVSITGLPYRGTFRKKIPD